MEGGREGGENRERSTAPSLSEDSQQPLQDEWHHIQRFLTNVSFSMQTASLPVQSEWRRERVVCFHFHFCLLDEKWRLTPSELRSNIWTHILRIQKSWIRVPVPPVPPGPPAQCRSFWFLTLLTCDSIEWRDFYLWHLMAGSEPQCGFIKHLQRLQRYHLETTPPVIGQFGLLVFSPACFWCRWSLLRVKTTLRKFENSSSFFQ